MDQTLKVAEGPGEKDVSVYTKMVTSIKVNMIMTLCMGTGYLYGTWGKMINNAQKIDMKVNTNIISKMALELFTGKMGEYIKDSGQMENNTDLEYLQNLVSQSTH
jgi:anthranilate/para-aminobenzoate synthase component II